MGADTRVLHPLPVQMCHRLRLATGHSARWRPPPSPGHKAVQSVSSKYLLCASASKSSETSPLSPVLGQSTSVSAQFLLRARHGAIGCTEVRAPLVPVRPQSCRSPREVVWMGPKGGGWGRLPESQMSRSLDGWRRGAGVPDQGAVCAA